MTIAGYIITLDIDGKSYLYHASENGDNTVLVSAPPMATEAVISWQYESDNQPCQSLQISLTDIAGGYCEGEIRVSRWQGLADELAELQEMVGRFAPFSAQTMAGTITFNGTGTQIADSAQQQMIAEWMMKLAEYRAENE